MSAFSTLIVCETGLLKLCIYIFSAHICSILIKIPLFFLNFDMVLTLKSISQVYHNCDYMKTLSFICQLTLCFRSQLCCNPL